MFLASKVPARIRRLILKPSRRMLYLYSDLAYYNYYGVIAPFNERNSAVTTTKERAFNYRISGIRILVEHSFSIAFKL